ncbi:MAG: nicotinate-nucleotide adenylyltransferase [Gammaproteobacteria bacterium]|nr:nicotinate-nucleotide adenylyltransferase [Gammaproteobacteria bacterium]
MTTFQKPIGVMGGSFDPIHFGHLRTATELVQIIDLQKILLIPCQAPVHKERSFAAPQHRLAMIQLALADDSRIVASDQELIRETPSYTIETLTALRKTHPDVPLVLIMGSDAFVNIATWKNWHSIPDFAHIVVAVRAGQKMHLDSEIERFLKTRQTLDYGDLHETLAGKIFLQFVTPLDISSTAIRCQLEAGYSPRYLLPDTVLAYIKTHHLYELLP